MKKVWNGEVDEQVHMQFSKFSKGEFKEKAMIKAKNSSGKFSISTTPEYANELIRMAAEKITEPVKVSGVVISTRDLGEELEFKDKKQFMGVKKYVIEKEMSKEEILNLCDKFPKAFIGLSFKAGDTELKIKPKAPKTGKAGSKAKEEPKIDFCKLKTQDKELVKNLIFDVPDFKEIEIQHTFIINEIIMPEGEKDFAKIREKAKRKGKIIREIKVDGQTTKKEKEFAA
jgi:hypothetical protein